MFIAPDWSLIPQPIYGRDQDIALLTELDRN